MKARRDLTKRFTHTQSSLNLTKIRGDDTLPNSTTKDRVESYKSICLPQQQKYNYIY